MTETAARPSQPHLDEMRAMVVAALGDRLAPGVDDYSDLFADDAVLEVPFDQKLRLVGRAAIDAHTRSLLGKIVLGPMTVTGRYLCGPDEMVVEYNGFVDDLTRSVRFHQTYVGIFRSAAGRLTLWREYLDPMVLPRNSGRNGF